MRQKSRALLASLYMTSGDDQKAEELIDEGLRRKPTDAGLKKVKARLMLARGDSQSTVELLDHAPPAFDMDAEYHELRAAALQYQNRAEDAVNIYYELLKNDSGQARLWVGLGYSLELVERLDESRKAYENSLRVPEIEDRFKAICNTAFSSVGAEVGGPASMAAPKTRLRIGDMLVQEGVLTEAQLMEALAPTEKNSPETW